jgi:ergothioneine biosynthesis protein EgtB
MITHSDTRSRTLLQRYRQVRTRTEKICAPLLPEDTVVQPMVDVSPPKWHLAHTSWFFETFVLQPFCPEYRLFHPSYSFLFNSYYNSVGNRVQRAERGTLTRPALAEIYAYRRHVDEAMQAFLRERGGDLPEEAEPVLELGLQHEQQHQELLITDIKYILSTNPLLPPYQSAPDQRATPAGSLPEIKYLEVPGGLYQIGYSGEGFHFDNEKGVHQVYLNDFRIANRLVTNKEYLEFIKDGGYRDFRPWLMEGFELAKQQEWQAPLYWLQEDDQWLRYTLHGLEPLHPDGPVCHLSFYEADAYANWAGKRLLTEFEWEAATQFFPPAPDRGSFQENDRYDPLPLSPGFAEDTCQQLLGDLWEWTYSAYLPYPGFSKAPGALGEYNGKFMINQMVLRGGSCATPRSHIRPTYRNFFHADKRWQFTGLRLADK